MDGKKRCRAGNVSPCGQAGEGAMDNEKCRMEITAIDEEHKQRAMSWSEFIIIAAGRK